jgi:prepilin-type N-terminal cleavage/methylation domain-containing protein
MRSPTRGFSLIEILVVITIVGILSSVVLASLNSARNKGKNSTVESNLNNARAQAELFYDVNGNSYRTGAINGPGDLCAISANVGGVRGIYSFVKAAADAQGVNLRLINSSPNSGDANNAVCKANATNWVMAVPLKPYGSFTSPMLCMDSTGAVKVTNLGPGGTQPVSGAPSNPVSSLRCS